MAIHGSSSIHPPTAVGPIGATGATGSIGPFGSFGPTGGTGATGATGTYVASSFFIDDDPNLYLKLSDGTEIKVEGLSGVTGETGTAEGLTASAGYALLKEVTDGVTFWFKGISAEGSMLVYSDSASNIVGISGDKQIQPGGYTGTDAKTYEFLYLSTTATAETSGLYYEANHAMADKLTDFTGTTGWTYDPEERIISVAPIERDSVVDIYGHEWFGEGPVAGQGVGIQLAITAGSVFDIQTPIGIAGFTGDFDQTEIFRFTMLLNGNDLWSWPDNIYFDPTDRFFSCGTDIIGFSTRTAGKTWLATVASRGYNVENCESVYGIGSCCYIDDHLQNRCEDFITKEECDTRNDSYWNPLATCADNCGLISDGGVCCSEGGNWFGVGTAKCIENLGAEECNYFGGSYFPFQYYNWEREDDSEIYFPVLLEPPTQTDCEIPPAICTTLSNIFGVDTCQWCVDPCASPVACCKGGSCIGDSAGELDNLQTLGPISAAVCVFVYGGVPVPDQICGDFDCCDYIVHEGACCVPEQQGGFASCTVTDSSSCLGLSGVFMGPGTECEGEFAIDCCYDDVGWCCAGNGNCFQSYQQDCGENNFYNTQAECVEECAIQGSCCRTRNTPDGYLISHCYDTYTYPCLTPEWCDTVPNAPADGDCGLPPSGGIQYSNFILGVSCGDLEPNQCPNTSGGSCETNEDCPPAQCCENQICQECPVTTTTEGTGPPTSTLPTPETTSPTIPPPFTTPRPGTTDKPGTTDGPIIGPNTESGGGGGGGGECEENWYCIQWAAAPEGVECERGPNGAPVSNGAVSCAKCVKSDTDLTSFSGMRINWSSFCPGDDLPDMPNQSPACGGGEYEVGLVGASCRPGPGTPPGSSCQPAEDGDSVGGIEITDGEGTESECMGKYGSGTWGEFWDSEGNSFIMNLGSDDWFTSGGCCQADHRWGMDGCSLCDGSKSCHDCNDGGKNGDSCNRIGGEHMPDEDMDCPVTDYWEIGDHDPLVHRDCRNQCGSLASTCNIGAMSYKTCMVQCYCCNMSMECCDDPNFDPDAEPSGRCDGGISPIGPGNPAPPPPPMPLPLQYVKLPNGNCVWMESPNQYPECN